MKSILRCHFSYGWLLTKTYHLSPWDGYLFVILRGSTVASYWVAGSTMAAGYYGLWLVF